MGHPPAGKAREEFADAITVRRSAISCGDVAGRLPWCAYRDLRLLEDLDDRMDLVDARAGLAEANKKGAKSLDVILQDLGSEFFQ
jgi:hypothetical protein